jgi:hypothetical protein
MNFNKIHLVPQAVLDCAEGLNNTKQDNLRLNYILRLEAIREFCDLTIRKHNMEVNTNVFKRGRGSRPTSRGHEVVK